MNTTATGEDQGNRMNRDGVLGYRTAARPLKDSAVGLL